jgi:hypothetical protein
VLEIVRVEPAAAIVEEIATEARRLLAKEHRDGD